ncbi:sulfurtransferase [Curvibacter sp. CHRR-16]|uniref:sulfurtransferase n=1 Tax=Curvibacter sp. CHRR-16 TaxID=2835872 RepID=UPI001BDA376B|nr:sulfurtransferase [Curvibacter sp. CHRR-16]MBT0570793.1 sulfurtransferase [Curvibacter sp. CHRR-16]
MTTSTPHYSTLISPEELQTLRAQGQTVMVFDCSFELMNPVAGPAQFDEVRIAGAVYTHLDTALSAKGAGVATASGGRHPLPTREHFAQWLTSVGFTNGMQAVVYDRQGVNYCGRLWWMLRWLGHQAVAVLDGGLQAWQAAGLPTESGPAPAPSAAAQAFALHEPLVRLVDASHVQATLGQPQYSVIDARATPRYKGEMEPIDPKAGHIPGALNRPFSNNIGSDGRFKPAEQLRAEFAALLGQRDAAHVIHHCGSGVSAVPNVLAMEIAGLGTPALYAGSWSDWCSDASRPVAQG